MDKLWIGLIVFVILIALLIYAFVAGMSTSYDESIETGNTDSCLSYGCQNNLINRKLDLIMEELDIDYHG